MTIQEFYTEIEGNYESMLGRLCNEALIHKFLLKFLDEKSYGNLMTAVEENNIENAIAAAHQMKGVVSNLSFDKLVSVLVELLSDLRQENQTVINMELIELVKEYYQKIIALIKLVE